jgi:hypothetical protein
VHAVEEINRGGVLTLEDLDPQFAHEPGQGHPEVVSHQHDALDVISVALPEGSGKFRVLLRAMGVKPEVRPCGWTT